MQILSILAATAAVMTPAIAVAKQLPPAGAITGNLPAFLAPGDTRPLALGPNLVTNGSFETGDFSGWTQDGDTSFTFVTDELAGGGPTDGVFHAASGPVDDFGFIFQTIPTIVGGVYQLSFDLASLETGTNGFGLIFGEQLLIIAFDVEPFDYQTISGEVVATSSSSDIVFGFFNPPSYWLLDNVSLQFTGAVIPEPATWGMLITGFGLVGATLRRRRPAHA